MLATPLCASETRKEFRFKHLLGMEQEVFQEAGISLQPRIKVNLLNSNRLEFPNREDRGPVANTKNAE